MTPELTIRRLDIATDITLYKQAWQWTANAPQWLRDCAKTFEAADEAAYLAAVTNPARIDIGVFTPEFTGMISVILRGRGLYEAYLAAARGSALETLGAATLSVYHRLTAYGMKQTFVWIAARNRAIIELCEGVGFERTGLEMWKGQSHGRPIHWRQMAIYGAH